MDRIPFTFEETEEEVVFCVLGSTQYNDFAYLIVVDERTLDEDDQDAYILKAVETDDIDVFYELVDDDDEIEAVLPALQKFLSDFEIEGY